MVELVFTAPGVGVGEGVVTGVGVGDGVAEGAVLGGGGPPFPPGFVGVTLPPPPPPPHAVTAVAAQKKSRDPQARGKFIDTSILVEIALLAECNGLRYAVA
jgi:hypothetical protein